MISPGVRALEHTADVGIAVRAESLPQLFERAARGMSALILDEAPEARHRRREPSATERSIELDADDVASLLVLWLRELLYLQEVEDFAPLDVCFDELSERRLRARVGGSPAPGPPVRELKGVTYHGLAVERVDDGWRARVIFDV